MVFFLSAVCLRLRPFLASNHFRCKIYLECFPGLQSDSLFPWHDIFSNIELLNRVSCLGQLSVVHGRDKKVQEIRKVSDFDSSDEMLFTVKIRQNPHELEYTEKERRRRNGYSCLFKHPAFGTVFLFI